MTGRDGGLANSAFCPCWLAEGYAASQVLQNIEVFEIVEGVLLADRIDACTISEY